MPGTQGGRKRLFCASLHVQFHVQRGFNKDDNQVTFMAAYPPVESIDYWSAMPDEHIRWWVHLVSPLSAWPKGGPHVDVLVSKLGAVTADTLIPNYVKAPTALYLDCRWFREILPSLCFLSQRLVDELEIGSVKGV